MGGLHLRGEGAEVDLEKPTGWFQLYLQDRDSGGAIARAPRR
jgi:hypothetical protein